MEDGDPGRERAAEPLPEPKDRALVRLVNAMIQEAHAQGVSDIHIECRPGREKVRIRFRKDGVLRPYLEMPPDCRGPLLARLKAMGELDLEERRQPQDGSIAFARFVAGTALELRLATIPTQDGLEDAVLRLRAARPLLALHELGLAPQNLAGIQHLLTRPHGLLLCVGPGGAGKTTALHAMLQHIDRPDRKIWTVEDPVEITQPGLRQVQINSRIDWTYPRALQALLQADADVIMVGEIGDAETAQLATGAALAGHLVLSTMHTQGAPETVARLLDMGMDPFNLGDALLGVLAQRRVRRLCAHCRQPHDAQPDEIDELLRDHLQPMPALVAPMQADAVLADWRSRHGSDSGRLTLYRSVGCEHCHGSGYSGHAGIHELLTITPALRRLIQTRPGAGDLQRHALGAGLRTLRQDGIEKVLAGVTTIDEVRANS